MILIDADAFKQTFCAECVASTCENCRINYHFEHLAPTVDPVKHGKWISTDNNGCAPYKCSICGGGESQRQVWSKTPYCAMCGAKMDIDLISLALERANSILTAEHKSVQQFSYKEEEDGNK